MLLPQASICAWICFISTAVHCPFSMIYHLQLAWYQTNVHPVDNLLRVLDQSFILITGFNLFLINQQPLAKSLAPHVPFPWLTPGPSQTPVSHTASCCFSLLVTRCSRRIGAAVALLLSLVLVCCFSLLVLRSVLFSQVLSFTWVFKPKCPTTRALSTRCIHVPFRCAHSGNQLGLSRVTPCLAVGSWGSPTASTSAFVACAVFDYLCRRDGHPQHSSMCCLEVVFVSSVIAQVPRRRGETVSTLRRSVFVRPAS